MLRLPPAVAPYTGAWIEIKKFCHHHLQTPSLPTRERGLKSSRYSCDRRLLDVAPYTGAWIEMYLMSHIERDESGSLPTRERGLKYNGLQIFIYKN